MPASTRLERQGAAGSSDKAPNPRSRARERTPLLSDVDEWQTEMQLKPMRVGRISLYTSGLSDEERALTGVETIANLDETIARSIALAEDPCVAVIPEGPYVVPYFHAA
jgi:hypothetical protein